MLLNFKMENFRSFKDETFFTMLSSKQKTHNDYVIDKSVNGNKLRVLPMTVIYGANACGKSNIVLAMDILKKMVMKGTLNCKELESYKSMLSFIRDTSWYDPVSLEITFPLKIIFIDTELSLRILMYIKLKKRFFMLMMTCSFHEMMKIKFMWM